MRVRLNTPLRIVVSSTAFGMLVTFAVAACRPSDPPPSTGIGVPPPASASESPSPSPSATTASPSPSPTGSTKAPPVGNPGACPAFPADNVWHAKVTSLPVHKNSAAYVTSIGTGRAVHPDFGSGLLEGKPWGIPVTKTAGGVARVPVGFDEPDESDPGPYPIPSDALVEGGPGGDGDRHVIVLDSAACKVYEMYDAHKQGGGWHAFSGAVFDLRANRMRPIPWTSADAAGLSIYAGLVSYDEVASGHVDHAIRMTVQPSQHAFLWPASHQASKSTDANLPPMGLRLRLRAGVDISKFPPQARVVAQALKEYGAIVADNGGNWFFSGTQDERWNNDQIDTLKRLHGSDFEAVDESSLMVSANSYAVKG
jgi:hypothetical protein